MAGISEGEVAIYDRQLRLWGVQAQQRLLKSKALIWGLEGSNVEVCKNLVLAGVSLVLRDHRDATGADIAYNYFLRLEDAGKKRSECAAKRVQEMNPLCAVASSTTAPETDAAALKTMLKEYDVVCIELGVLGWDVDLARTIDAACREVKTSFFLTLSSGEIAFSFTNLHEHIMQERSSAQGAGAPAPTQTAAHETHSFPSFGEWLETTPAELLASKVDVSVQLFAMFLAFLRKDKSLAGADNAQKFEDYCQNVAKCAPTIDGVASLQDAYKFLFLEPLVHVASVLGGLLAQEVIKAITFRDPPMVNTVCFNAHGSVAFVERIPAPQAVKKRKVEETFDLDD